MKPIDPNQLFNLFEVGDEEVYEGYESHEGYVGHEILNKFSTKVRYFSKNM